MIHAPTLLGNAAHPQDVELLTLSHLVARRLRSHNPSMKTVLILGRDEMGHGDRELGQKILATMLRKARGAFPDLEALAFFNSGVRLVCEGSPVLFELTQLHESGVDLMPCGTCLSHFELEPSIGSVSDMDSILREIARADKAVTL